MAQQWTVQDIPSQSGKIAVVTGANSGLGPETNAGLAAAGATVGMGECTEVRALGVNVTIVLSVWG